MGPKILYMKKIVPISIAILLTMVSTPNYASANVVPGGKCTVLGKVTNSSNKKFTCSKRGNKLVWKVAPSAKSSIPLNTLDFKGIKFTYPTKIVLPGSFAGNSNECVSIPITVKSPSLGYQVIIYVPDAKQTNTANLLGDPKSATEFFSPTSLNQNIAIKVCNYDTQPTEAVTISKISPGPYFLAISDWGFNRNTPGVSFVYANISFISE
jgi:hypothetical protein